MPIPRSFILAVALFSVIQAVSAEDDPLAAWRHEVSIRDVAPDAERHSIHAYFNTSPESPDGQYVLYYTSETKDGEYGDLRILERKTGREIIVAPDITTEDAHRAACQQWSSGGKSVVYHEVRNGQWRVMVIDVATLMTRVLAEDRQVGFGSAMGQWIPVYGQHWNPGIHRNLELVNVVTGEVRTPVTVEDVVREYGDWIQGKFGTSDISIFFPVMCPDESKVFFKLSRPGGGDDFRSKKASYREGKVVYDLKSGQFIRLIEQWGHPSWSPDGTAIFEKGNYSFNLATGAKHRPAPSSISDHPSIAPNGKLFVTDADVTKRPFGQPGYWAIAVGSMERDESIVLTVFDNTNGATTWRHNHPHPAFSADGNRIYYNVNEGPWTRLMVAECQTSE